MKQNKHDIICEHQLTNSPDEVWPSGDEQGGGGMGSWFYQGAKGLLGKAFGLGTSTKDKHPGPFIEMVKIEGSELKGKGKITAAVTIYLPN